MFAKNDANSSGRKDVTNEEKKSMIAALLEERAGYEKRVLRAEEEEDEEKVKEAKERVAGVNASLRALGEKAEKPAERAQKRPAQKASSQR